MGIVRWSASASTLPRRLSLVVRGQGALFTDRPVVSALRCRQPPAVMGQGHWSRVGLARRLYCAARCQGGQLAGHKTSIGSSEIRLSA
ncbi:hypothetical protein GW17_00027725 [Ensete ventricosum]|nr:hypothetical protein GW17_00027725 [Ensete ventricosum]